MSFDIRIDTEPSDRMTDKFTIAEELLNALDEYTAGCTIVIASADPKIPHGSGVAVKYGGKQYILTAAHVVRNEPDNRKIRILGKADAPLQLLKSKKDFEEAIAKGIPTPAFSRATPIIIKSRLIHDGDDIAAIEVENINANLPHTGLHELSSQGETQVTPDQPVTIHGFPGQLAKPYEHKPTGQRGLSAFPHVTIQTVKDLSIAPREKDPNINFITDFDYAIEEQLDPHGMSGCGAWSIPAADKEGIWSAGKTELLGIQVAYDRPAKVLVFVRIVRVSRLLTGKG
jgi:hypothetical protein